MSEALGGKPQRSERMNAGSTEPDRFRNRRHECHRCAEAESDHDDGQLVFGMQPVERGDDIGRLGHAFVMSFAETGAAKIEAQHRPAQAPLRRIQHLHGVVDDFVVHGAAAEGMRMADKRGEARIGRAFIQQRL